jgi:hypothetical protein
MFVEAVNDMGHLSLYGQNGVSVDLNLYRLVHQDVRSEIQMYDGYGLCFYRLKNPKLKTKEYFVNGQKYVVDFSQL